MRGRMIIGGLEVGGVEEVEHTYGREGKVMPHVEDRSIGLGCRSGVVAGGAWEERSAASRWMGSGIPPSCIGICI